MNRSLGFALRCGILAGTLAVAGHVGRGLEARAGTVQQQLETPVNYWLTGNNSAPSVQQIVSYAVDGQYAYVYWTTAHGNSGGVLLLSQASPGVWKGVFSTGGAFRYGDLINRGLSSTVAEYFTNSANFIAATIDAPVQTPGPNATMARALP
jgi:hypothetical protein